MKSLLGIAVLLTGVAGSSPARVLHGYGMSVAIPAGWHGTISHGLIRIRGPRLRLMLRESTPRQQPDPFFRRRTMPTLNAQEFSSAEHHLGFTLSGRHFALLPFPAKTPSAAAIRTANAILHSFTAKRGNYYGDPLPPARFPARTGWFVGARGGRLLAEGGQTEAWAATVPYRDPPLQIPPHRTLGRLSADGIIIWLSLSRDSALRLRPMNSPHIRRQLIANNFEGLPRGIGLYRASVRETGYDLDLWVFFKTVRPTTRVVGRAQAEIDRLQLPTWPAG